jgi:hypothetical protein
MNKSKPRKHDPKWADNTAKQRNINRTAQDNAWANAISNGKYPTLRKLMTAIHNGDLVLTVKR